MNQPLTILLTLILATGMASAETPATRSSDTPGEAPARPASGAPAQTRDDALEKLNLPGIEINVDEWSVDVAGTVALRDGLLELVACMKNTKEHESIVAVEAKPSHIHAALLLLGAEAGSPASREMVGDGPDADFIDVPPRGGLVDVYLVLDTPDGRKEHPISDFIVKVHDAFDAEGNPLPPVKNPDPFPTHTFMFTGSLLVEPEEGQPRRYIADYSGNVITLVTFGDEMMSKPGLHDDANHALMWQIKNDKLPALDAPVTLRLKPQRPGSGAQSGE